MAFDKTLPIEGALAPTYNNIMRADKTALEAALDAYFRFATGGTQTGQPRQGSSRIYYQDAAPAARLDGDYFDSTDLGCLWIDSNSAIDNQFNWLSAADGSGTDTWTPVSTEIIAFLVAQANAWADVQTFSVSPAFTKGIAANNTYLTCRNAADDGNVDLIKADGSDVPTVPDDAANATSGAPTADASLANKKYVDDQISAIQDPTYSGGESHTFDGGLIIKQGSVTVAENTVVDVTYGTAFPTAFKSAQATFKSNSTNINEAASVLAKSGSETSILQVTNSTNVSYDVFWQAWGR